MSEQIDLRKNPAIIESDRCRNEKKIQEINAYLDQINADVEEIRKRFVEIESERIAAEEKWA